jgi:phosphoribosyl 1,2-cyclic phosphate phosphodiesterase
MKIRLLGCGTSTGVPVIGCDCAVCTSDEPRNRRTRASILVEAEGAGDGPVNILIDSSTDLRAQALRENVRRIDAVLYTHHHADHIHGIDELRSFNRIQDEETIPCYGDAGTMSRISEYFKYIFGTTGAKNEEGGWKPNLSCHSIDGPFDVRGVRILPLDVKHGEATILAFRIKNLAYLTDCSSLPDEAAKLLDGVDLLIVGALRDVPHPSHFSVRQALEAGARIGARRTILTHLGHSIDYRETSLTLPKNAELAYDGMTIEL